MFGLTLKALVVFYWDRPFLSGWAFLLFYSEENRFWLVWLINFFNQPQTRLLQLENCSIEKCQPYQFKPVAVETVDASRPRPVICACFSSIIRYHDFYLTPRSCSMLFLTFSHLICVALPRLPVRELVCISC